MAYLSRINQNVVADSLNSSTANLNAGSSFVGTASSTLGVAGLQIGLKTDQNATVYVEQSPGLGTGTGTVTTNGTITLNGSGTNFLSRKVGDQIYVSGETVRIIATISSDTVLTVTVAFSTSVGSLSYQMYNWDISDSYTYYSAIDNFGITVQAISSFLRVRVTNNGSSATTFLRLNTVLCPIVEAVPRSLDASGNLKVGVKSIADDYGFTVENTPMGEQRTAQITRLVGAQFDGSTIDTNYWTATTLNSATVTQANAEVTLTSGTNSAGSAQLNSVRRARYVSANGMRFRGVIQLGDTGTASNTRKWGVTWGTTMPTYTDGAYFQLTGTTFSIVTLKGSSPTTVNSGSFNGQVGSTYAPTTSATTYEIYWINSKVWFVVGGTLLHTVSASSTTWAATMMPHIYMDNINSGNTTSVTLKCRVASIVRLGQLTTQPSSKQQVGTTAGNLCKIGPGNLHSILISTVSNGSIITLWDNITATGTAIWSATMVTTGGNNMYNNIYTVDFKGLPFFNGLTLQIATANATCTVIYE